MYACLFYFFVFLRKIINLEWKGNINTVWHFRSKSIVSFKYVGDWTMVSSTLFLYVIKFWRVQTF